VHSSQRCGHLGLCVRVQIDLISSSGSEASMTRFATQTINGLLTLANILQVPTAELLVCLKRADAGGVLTRVEGSGLAAGDEGCHDGQNGGGLEHHFGVRVWDVSLDFEFEGIR